jgi:GTP-binding protein
MSAYPDACFLASAHTPAQFLADDGREVAFAGRSNSGKSSAINAILGRRGLARTSKTPGRTQLVNFFAVGEPSADHRPAGLRLCPRARGCAAHWGKLMDAYFRQRQLARRAVPVMDVRHPLTDFDQGMLDWAGAAGCPVHMLLTKADKLSRGRRRRGAARFARRWGSPPTSQLFSALKGTGVEQARAALDAWLDIPRPARCGADGTPGTGGN